DALDPDRHRDEARERFGVPAGQEPTDEQVSQTREGLLQAAARPLAANPALRTVLRDLKTKFEQVIDIVSQDELLDAGHSAAGKEKAKTLVASFEQFLDEHRNDIEALQFFYSQPYTRRLRFADIKALAEAIKAPPRSWTPEILWRAYETLEKDKVRGASGQRLLTDIVSLVGYALHKDEALVPYGDRVRERFENWLAQQRNNGRQFTPEQLRWLEMIRDHVANSLEVTMDDFDFSPFAHQAGMGNA